MTAKVLNDLGELATQFNTHGRSLAEAVELLERSNRRTEDGVAQRQTSIETLVSTLDMRTDDFEQRLRRFSGLLEESLDAATTRAREIASIIAETSNESVRTIDAAVRAGAHHLRGGAQAHRRSAAMRSTSSPPAKSTACSASPPTASPRSCRA